VVIFDDRLPWRAADGYVFTHRQPAVEPSPGAAGTDHPSLPRRRVKLRTTEEHEAVPNG